MSTLIYIKNLIKDKHIASITPTFPSAVKELCNRIDFSKRVVIVEYGPATGVFTKYLLDCCTEDSLIIAIELNKNFVDYLNNHYQDTRLKVHHDSAENIDKIMASYAPDEIDYIISGIPFTLLPHDTRNTVVQKTNSVLREGGKFLAYQTFFQKDEHLKDHLVEHFSNVDDGFALKNIPPLRFYEATK